MHLPDVLRDVMLALALYKCHLCVAGCSGIEDSPDEPDRIRKSPLDFFFFGGGEAKVVTKFLCSRKSKRRLLKS